MLTHAEVAKLLAEYKAQADTKTPTKRNLRMNLGRLNMTDIQCGQLDRRNAPIHRLAASKVSKSRGGRSATSMHCFVRPFPIAEVRCDYIRIVKSLNSSTIPPLEDQLNAYRLRTQALRAPSCE